MKKINDLIYKSNNKLLLKNYILLESKPDFSCNTKAVYDEMIRRCINKKYKLIWFVDDKNKFKDIKLKNVKFINYDEKKINKIKWVYYNIRCKFIIDCNKFVTKRNHRQIRIHLIHGEFIKIPREYCNLSGHIDYLIETSDYFKKINSESFQVPEDNILTTGYPRNDYIFDYDNGIEVYRDIKRDKTIFWIPTYRNHKFNKNNSFFNTNIQFPYGIPTIKNSSDLKKLNNILKKNKTLLVIKFHPAEDISKIKKLDLSNIKLLEDDFFEKVHSNIYQLLSKADALITDYSSIYYDFLLTDKPNGLAIPDINEYKSHVELLYKDYENNIIGEYIYNFNDLLKFVNNVGKNNDIKYDKRILVKKKYHKYCDNNSSNRVVDIIEELLYRKVIK